MRKGRAALLAAAMTAVLLPGVLMPTAANAAKPEAPEPVAEVLATGLGGSIGSTIGPDGALYVAARENGEIVRVDTVTGATTVYASGLPTHPVGGIFDVAFLGGTAYALVSVVGPDVGGTATGGIYRIDDPDSSTLVADLATWSTENPPPTSFDVPSGVQYAFQPFGDGFLVSDGHHNRVLFVDLSGGVFLAAQFDNIVPTGLEVDGSKVYLAEAGPIPHDPADGKVVVGESASPFGARSGVGLQSHRGRRIGVVRPVRALAGRLARPGARPVRRRFRRAVSCCASTATARSRSSSTASTCRRHCRSSETRRSS